MEIGVDPKERISDPRTSVSKSGLYAALTLFANDGRDAKPSLSAKKLATTLKDSTLVNFLAQVGVYKNRKGSTSVCKNNGSRPLSQNDVSDRIRTKALVVLGGGINVSLSCDSKKSQQSLESQKLLLASNRKRKKAMLKRCLPSHEVFDKDTWSNLEVVNTKWNEYMCHHLKNEGVHVETANTRYLSKCIPRCITGVELIGSSVSVLKCPSNPCYVSKEGVLIAMTLKTWRIASRPRKDHLLNADNYCLVVVVPRDGLSVLQIVVPTNKSQKLSQEVCDKTRSLLISIT